MRQWIRKYSLTPSWTVNLKILLDKCVTVTFCPQLVFPIGKLEQDKYVWNDYSLYAMSIVLNSVKQCQTVSTVSTVSTVVARCYLHLRWYFLDQNNLGNCTMCDIIWVIFIGPRSNHCEALFVTASLTDSCCWDLTDVTLAFEESISKLLDIVCVANIEAQEHVDDSLADILKLKFGRHYQRHKWCLDLILCESSCCRY